MHFNQALELLSRLETPFSRAQTQVRAARALAISGDKEAASERLIEAYRTARKLGARSLASLTVRELPDLGEHVERRLGRRALSYVEGAGISGRELEVLQLISKGKTNRDIGHELFLSPRTVEMHVSNILSKLSCSSRAEAVHKAHGLSLLS